MTQLCLVAAIAFHDALMSFGWIFYLSAMVMIVAFGLLLRAERAQPAGPVALEERDERRWAT